MTNVIYSKIFVIFCKLIKLYVLTEDQTKQFSFLLKGHESRMRLVRKNCRVQTAVEVSANKISMDANAATISFELDDIS